MITPVIIRVDAVLPPNMLSDSSVPHPALETLQHAVPLRLDAEQRSDRLLLQPARHRPPPISTPAPSRNTSAGAAGRALPHPHNNHQTCPTPHQVTARRRRSCRVPPLMPVAVLADPRSQSTGRRCTDTTRVKSVARSQ